MGDLRFGVACVALCWGVADQAIAQRLSASIGGFEFTARGELSVQGATFEDPATLLSDEGGEWDGSLILNAERVTPSGLVYGLRGEIDTGNRAVEDLQRDEIYIYFAGEFGRVELGEQDGPADTISYHAPVLGLGQIRGDFSRYAGSLALLSPLDTSDAPKVVYLSAPQGGFRFGASYAPEYTANENNPDPRARTIQDNAFEVAGAYQTTWGGWAGGVSVAYVAGKADPSTERGDLDSWSVGVQFGRGVITVGGAYVMRGDSNSLVVGLDEEEINLGVAWRADNWGAAVSASQSTSSVFDNRLIGVGGYYEIGEFWVLRADLVSIDEDSSVGPSGTGYVGLAEIAFVF